MIETELKERIYRSTKLTAAIAVCRRYGLDDKTVLRNTGLEAERLDDPDYLISIHQLICALLNISEEKVSPTLPYEIGQSIHVSSYGMYGFAILSSRDFRETMKFAQKYHALATPICQIIFDESPGVEGWIIIPIDHPLVNATLRDFLAIMQIGVHISLHRDIMGGDFFPRSISVQNTKQCFYQLPVISGSSVSFGKDRNHLFIGNEWLDRDPTFGNILTFQQVEKICQNELSEIASKPGLSGRVRTLILQSMSDPKNIEEISEMLNMSSRTLRRHLTNENTSYREILDEIRSEIAIQYLRDSNLTTDEISYALGFGDVSSFRRAFVRWTGGSTNSFREQPN